MRYAAVHVISIYLMPYFRYPCSQRIAAFIAYAFECRHSSPSEWQMQFIYICTLQSILFLLLNLNMESWSWLICIFVWTCDLFTVYPICTPLPSFQRQCPPAAVLPCCLMADDICMTQIWIHFLKSLYNKRSVISFICIFIAFVLHFTYATFQHFHFIYNILK